MGQAMGRAGGGGRGGPALLKGDFIVKGLNEKQNKSNKRTDVGLTGEPMG